MHPRPEIDELLLSLCSPCDVLPVFICSMSVSQSCHVAMLYICGTNPSLPHVVSSLGESFTSGLIILFWCLAMIFIPKSNGGRAPAARCG